MLTGAHTILYSTNPDADRAFLRDVLALPHVDVGGGWLIFGLPPAEVAVHPGERSDRHELYLICEDVTAFAATMSDRGVSCGDIKDQGWGLSTEIQLPGGGKLGVYEPRHARPEVVAAKAKRAKPEKAGKNPMKKKAKADQKKAKADQKKQAKALQKTSERAAKKARTKTKKR